MFIMSSFCVSVIVHMHTHVHMFTHTSFYRSVLVMSIVAWHMHIPLPLYAAWSTWCAHEWSSWVFTPCAMRLSADDRHTWTDGCRRAHTCTRARHVCAFYTSDYVAILSHSLCDIMPGMHVHIAWAKMKRSFAVDGYSGHGTILIASSPRHRLSDYSCWVSDGSACMPPMMHYDWTHVGTFEDFIGKPILATKPGRKQIRKHIGIFTEVCTDTCTCIAGTGPPLLNFGVGVGAGSGWRASTIRRVSASFGWAGRTMRGPYGFGLVRGWVGGHLSFGGCQRVLAFLAGLCGAVRVPMQRCTWLSSGQGYIFANYAGHCTMYVRSSEAFRYHLGPIIMCILLLCAAVPCVYSNHIETIVCERLCIMRAILIICVLLYL